MTILSNIFGGRTAAQPAQAPNTAGVIDVVSNQPGHVLGWTDPRQVYGSGLQNQQQAIGPGNWQSLSQLGTHANALRQHPAFDPNTNPAMQCSLEMLHGLWAAKHGWDWVQLETPTSSDFDWARGVVRLQRMLLLESEMGWYRLVPKTWT